MLGFVVVQRADTRQIKGLAAFALEDHIRSRGWVGSDRDAHEDRCAADLAIFNIFRAAGADIDAELECFSAPGTSVVDSV